MKKFSSILFGAVMTVSLGIVATFCVLVGWEMLFVGDATNLSAFIQGVLLGNMVVFSLAAIFGFSILADFLLNWGWINTRRCRAEGKMLYWLFSMLAIGYCFIIGILTLDLLSLIVGMVYAAFVVYAWILFKKYSSIDMKKLEQVN